MSSIRKSKLQQALRDLVYITTPQAWLTDSGLPPHRCRECGSVFPAADGHRPLCGYLRRPEIELLTVSELWYELEWWGLRKDAMLYTSPLHRGERVDMYCGLCGCHVTDLDNVMHAVWCPITEVRSRLTKPYHGV